MDDNEELSRSDMRLIRAALRQDWPIPDEVKRKLLQRLIDYVDRDHEDGATAPDRTVIMAARTIGVFADLSLKQAKLDLAREKLAAGRTSEGTLADCVAEAERLAEERERERERVDDGR